MAVGNTGTERTIIHNHSQKIFFSPVLGQQQWIIMNTWDISVSFKLCPGLSPSHMKSMGVLWKEQNGLYIEFWTEGKAALISDPFYFKDSASHLPTCDFYKSLRHFKERTLGVT